MQLQVKTTSFLTVRFSFTFDPVPGESIVSSSISECSLLHTFCKWKLLSLLTLLLNPSPKTMGQHESNSVERISQFLKLHCLKPFFFKPPGTS